MKKILRISILVLLGIIILGTFYFLYQKSKPKVIVYEIVSPSLYTIEKKTVATGKIEPRDEILIKPQINGIIAELYKEAGQNVRIDEVIAKVKVVPEMGALNASESRVNIAEIDFEKAKIDFERIQNLYKTGVVAQEEFEQGEVKFKRAKEEIQSAKDAMDIVKTGISKRSASYSTTLIRSTVNGLVLDVPVKIGSSVVQSNNFNDGTTIASIANMRDLLFKGKIDETEIGRIHKGMNMNLILGALQEIKLNATLEQISPKGTEENGAIMFEIKAAVQAPDSVFVRAGYSANAEIITAKRDNVLTIPESCVEFKGDTAFVYMLLSEKPKQEFKQKAVKLGLSDGIRIEILSGLSSKDRIRGNPIDPNK